MCVIFLASTMVEFYTLGGREGEKRGRHQREAPPMQAKACTRTAGWVRAISEIGGGGWALRRIGACISLGPEGEGGRRHVKHTNGLLDPKLFGEGGGGGSLMDR